MFNVGDYTFAPWKVVWREQSAWFTAAVVGSQDGKCIVPDHKLMLVDCQSEEEAYYLAGVLNSSPVTLAVWAYAISIQQTAHITENINVPSFDAKKQLHLETVNLSKQAHALAAAGDKAARAALKQVESEIDRAAAQLWGLTDEELRDIQASLKELKG
ncbi:MAG: hypothetical protein Fur0018_22680 [Anaerolineales bacterium]